MALRVRKKKIRVREKQSLPLYYYVSLPIANILEESKLMEERISQLGVDVEYSKSPSGCRCYRIKRSDVRPGVGLPERVTDEWNTIPFGLPCGTNYKEHTSWAFSPVNYLECIYKEWHRIPRSKKRVRKQTGKQIRKRRVR